MSDIPANSISAKKEADFVWGFHDDLATVSCYAAGEVDDLILGRSRSFDALKRLLEMLRNSLISSKVSASPESLIDPTTAVAMNRAFENSDPPISMSTVEELLTQSNRVAKLLERVITEPQRVREAERDKLENLRSLCLELSNSALACEEPIEDIQSQVP